MRLNYALKFYKLFRFPFMKSLFPFPKLKNLLLTGLVIISLQVSVSAQNTVWQKTNSALIQLGGNNTDTIPLILIHGIHGTENCEERGKLNDYWNDFRGIFLKAQNNIKSKFTINVFQYCSDVVEVSDLALELRDLIDENLTDRNHVLLAHSMGGLVAKSYMAETVHLKGKWKSKTGGDTTIGIITLATPHHGTPGANSPETLEDFFKFGWKTAYKAANKTYWSVSLGNSHPAVNNSSLPNRSDLRWDNYDFKLDSFSTDLNKKLFNRNLLFKKYAPRLIAYSGALNASGLNTAEKLLDEIARFTILIEISDDSKNHRRLEFANAGMVYGLDRKFGDTDGLVPLKSGLFCESEQILTSPNTQKIPPPKNYVCKTSSRVRRFESGDGGEVAKSDLPDIKTLSIFRSKRGFDHLDMQKHPDVLNYVVKDLKVFSDAVNNDVQSIKPFSVPEIPTLFLMDISDSMNESNKIAQAKNAGMSAVSEMKDNRRRGQDNSSVAVWTFGGECSERNVKRLLPFTSNLNQVENTFLRGIPKPNGLTPLYTAINLSVVQMTDYLSSRTDLNEAKIIVMTDGLNTCSEQIRPRGVYSQSSNNRVYRKVRFYCIGFNIAPGSKEERDLQYLASASGGKYFPARNAQRLNRAFQKVVRVYVPKVSTNAEVNRGSQQILKQDYENALKILLIHIKENPNDATAYYNLAITCEALENYKCAAENYRQYLRLVSDSGDSKEVQINIEKLEGDYVSEIEFYTNVLKSDLEYLKAYYKRLFELKNDELSAEFAGFVAEKSQFYRNLTQILEIRSSRIDRSSAELADSLDYLNRRVGLPSFDRDAVSLLTLPISHLEDLIRNLENHKY